MSQTARRFAQIVKLKPQHLAEYKEVHARVWPDVLKQIQECNIRDYSIFYDDQSHILFASFKYIGSDYSCDMEKMAKNPRVREWWKMTDAWQESLVHGAVSSEAGEPSWWKPVEEVFYQPLKVNRMQHEIQEWYKEKSQTLRTHQELMI